MFVDHANGCICVQGTDELERTGFIELSDVENPQYARAFYLTVPQRKDLEENDTHVNDALDMLIGWLDIRMSGAHRCFAKRNTVALNDNGHLHPEAPKPTTTGNEGVAFSFFCGHRCMVHDRLILQT